MTRLTKNFTLEELTTSYTAKRLHIDNTPDDLAKKKLRLLCEKILQPLRDAWGEPIVVGSGYRCRMVNAKVGGVANSDHLYGCAADIKTLGDSPENNKRLFELAVGMMRSGQLEDVKQIIDEYHYDWIHISWQDGRSTKHNQVLHIK